LHIYSSQVRGSSRFGLVKPIFGRWEKILSKRHTHASVQKGGGGGRKFSDSGGQTPNGVVSFAPLICTANIVYNAMKITNIY